jgi:protease-4
MNTPEDPSSSSVPGGAPLPPDTAEARRPASTGMASVERTFEQAMLQFLRERRTERRWRVFFRMAWLLVFVTLAYAIVVHRPQVVPPSGPHTALIEVRGEIASDSEASAETLIAGLKSAFEDTGAQAIVLRINSPGGSPVQAGIVYDEIVRLKAKHRKKVYAVVEEMCASGAYYIAVAADDIYVDKASLVGSIGVLMEGFGFVGLMDKLGIERRLLTAGENKGMLDPFSPQNEKHRAFAQALINQVHQQFIDVVKEGRGNRLKENGETFSGLFWNGEQAVKLGLADDFGTLDFVAREVIKAEEVIDYTPRESLAERLTRRFGASIGEGAVRALRRISPLR